jgi:hypothetical protein
MRAALRRLVTWLPAASLSRSRIANNLRNRSSLPVPKPITVRAHVSATAFGVVERLDHEMT